MNDTLEEEKESNDFVPPSTEHARQGVQGKGLSIR